MSKTIAWLVVAACSSGPGRPTQPPGPGSAAELATRAASPTERECEELFGHAIALLSTELGRSQPPELTPAQQAEERDQLRGELMTACRASSRDSYRCAIAATTIGELDACHSTRSNSTSNSSVAPGGIAPPAPRSP